MRKESAVKELNRFPQKTKCILISTPVLRQNIPRGLLSIASFLRSKGHGAEIVPLSYLVGFKPDWTFEEIEAILKDVIPKNDPVVVGVSNQRTIDYPVSIEILKICKQINENITTLIGGMHVTYLDKECLELPYVDVVVRGEGEWIMADLIPALENGADLHQIKGITFKEDGKIIRTPDRPVGNLHELPPLDFGLLPFDFVQKGFIVGMLSRGCPFHCNFCLESAFWKKRRSFTVEQFMNEMDVLEHVYKNPLAGIDDGMVAVGSKLFAELCSAMKKQKLSFAPDSYIYTRLDAISDQGMQNMKGTNIKYVLVGMESASSEILDSMDKNLSSDNIRVPLAKLRENDFCPSGTWMIGFPGDNPAKATSSVDLMSCLLDEDLISQNPTDVGFFTPYPGTPFFAEPEKYEIEILTKDWTVWLLSGMRLEPVCQLKAFPAEDMIAYRNKMIQAMYEKKKVTSYGGVENCIYPAMGPFMKPIHLDTNPFEGSDDMGQMLL